MTTQQRTDEEAVRDLLARADRAWEAGDATAFAAVFAPDADYTTWFGQRLKGREAIEASHVPLFAKYLKGTRTIGEITSVRFLAPDVALVHGMGAVVKGDKKRTRFNTKMVQYVVVRSGGEWSIAAFQNTKYHWLFNALFARQ
ncbi:SgcJ/EcaC family oxidoreductase [Nocardia sp. CDC153]|uniref:SgcJ/EcaC family oxidoreductase n=1 Tax=Nocardia sp. CDC153 TaxID=3112167 RepID=UPI002DB67793|nr:SgcJ/EcaC family oxidoreductase [Nocardia sp. CDC153]MEC3955623.1 SgcJ/EcaC family oxidoreductase [Nocardia sp. CDC153]